MGRHKDLDRGPRPHRWSRNLPDMCDSTAQGEERRPHREWRDCRCPVRGWVVLQASERENGHVGVGSDGVSGKSGEGTGADVSENQNLLAEQRRALILDEVRRRGGVRVNELTRKLGVSDMTVRRDLDALARQGVVEKVHGGAVPVAEATAHEPGFEAKSTLELSAKQDIAREAARMAVPGSAIALAGGTTAYAPAHQLVDVPDRDRGTNSLQYG